MKPSDNELWDEYLAVLPDEPQTESAARIGRDQSWFSRKEKARSEGALSLKRQDRMALRKGIETLTSDRPEARARREAYAAAARDVEELARKYRALSTSRVEAETLAEAIADSRDGGGANNASGE